MQTITIKNRFTGSVLFTADVADDDAYPMRTALTKAIAAGAYLAGAYLARANLAGANLADANLARANLADANLADADLADADLAGAYLAGANLADADLAGAYLAGAYLAGANLADADLADADLADADLADARNLDPNTSRTDPPEPYKRAVTDEDRLKRQADRAAHYRANHPDVPVVENLDAKILAAVAESGNAIDMATWHTCETTHCRAGWAIHLAGKAGYELEQKTNPERAGRMIYLASTGRVPNFFATNEGALEDLKRCATQSTPTTETPAI